MLGFLTGWVDVWSGAGVTPTMRLDRRVDGTGVDVVEIDVDGVERHGCISVATTGACRLTVRGADETVVIDERRTIGDVRQLTAAIVAVLDACG